MLRFVILTHDHPQLHWDFLVEREKGSPLRSWRLESPPLSGAKIKAEPLPDHRRIYLDYEGPVSGNRGEVERWDSGEARVLEETEGKIRWQVAGEKIRGEAALNRGTDGSWSFQYQEKQPADPGES